MSAFLLVMLLLSGPPAESQATLQIRLHLGANRESDIIRAELRRNDEWFLMRRLRIEASYRLILVEDLHRQRPWYEIGRRGDRQEFRPGTFCSSGTFLEALDSIAAFDRWERDRHFEPSISYDPFYGGVPAFTGERPEVFPPELPAEGEP